MNAVSDAARTGPRAFSVIIPTSGRPEFLLLAVDSARQQTYPPLEIIVVDNDPAGSAEAVLEPVMGEDERVRYLAAASVRGPSHARNAGAKQANGEYLAFLDDDDLWRPQFIGHVDAALEREPVQFVLGWIDVMEGEDITPGKAIPPTVSLSLLLRSGNLGVTGSNVVIHQELFDRIGGFDEELEYSEDRDLLIRLIARNFDYAVVQERDVIHRVHEGLQLTDLGNERRLAGATRFYRKHRSQMPLHIRASQIRNLHYAASHTRGGVIARTYHGLMASLLGDRRPAKEAVRRLTGRRPQPRSR